MNLVIIGAGKVGTVLGRRLVDRGHVVSCVISRSLASARKAGRFLRCPLVSTSLSAIPPEIDLVFITTPHGAVEGVARALAEQTHLDFRHIAVCHASGMLSAKVLEPVRKRGARVFSFHPLQTFPRDFAPRNIVPSVRGIYYGVDGSPRALRVGRVLARALEGKIVVIRPQMRPLYHVACVVASNHMTTMLWVVERMFTALGTRERKFYPVFKPILEATLLNVERTSPARALSGPVARGGVETVADHCAAIRRSVPDILPYFLQVSLETVALARAKGSITRRQERALRGLISSYSPQLKRETR